MHYIKDLFEKNRTEHAHNKFVRYSKGNFVGALIQIKFQRKGIRFNSSFHLVDELLELAKDVLGNDLVHIKGSVIWNKDLSNEFNKLGIKYLKVLKSRGIFKYTLDNDIHFKEFIDIFNNYFVLVNIKTENFSFTTKPSFPKPNKEFSNDFCKVLFPFELREKIISEFIFDVKNTEEIKEIEIKHEIEIKDIIVPKTEKFEEARRLATRKGILKRLIYINGSKTPIISKINFEI